MKDNKRESKMKLGKLKSVKIGKEIFDIHPDSEVLLYDICMTGKELRERRISAGLSPDDLSKILHVTRSCIYLWENDKRRIPYSIKIIIGNMEVLK